MRRLIVGLAVTAVATLAPCWGLANDQQMATNIAKTLRSSGRLSNFKIGVSYQNGVAWLHGRVTSEDQMAEAIKMTERMEGVTQVVNQLSIGDGAGVKPAVRLAQRAEANSPASVKQVVYPEQAEPRRLETDAAPRQIASRPSPMPTARSAKTAAVKQARVPARPVAAQPVEAPEGPVYEGEVGGYAGPAYGGYQGGYGVPLGTPIPAQMLSAPAGSYDQPHMCNHAWPSYAAYPNYAAVNYPRQYSPTAWPFIGPFYPYPQVPLGWRKVTLEWDDGWWFLDFDDQECH